MTTEQVGRTAALNLMNDPRTIARVRIGDVVYTGTGINVRRYRDLSRRLVVEIELVDGLAL